MDINQNNDSNSDKCNTCVFQWDCESSKAGECILDDIKIKDKVTKRYNKKKDKKMKNKKYEEYSE